MSCKSCTSVKKLTDWVKEYVRGCKLFIPAQKVRVSAAPWIRKIFCSMGMMCEWFYFIYSFHIFLLKDERINIVLFLSYFERCLKENRTSRSWLGPGKWSDGEWMPVAHLGGATGLSRAQRCFMIPSAGYTARAEPYPSVTDKKTCRDLLWDVGSASEHTLAEWTTVCESGSSQSSWLPSVRWEYLYSDLLPVHVEKIWVFSGWLVILPWRNLSVQRKDFATEYEKTKVNRREEVEKCKTVTHTVMSINFSNTEIFS